jgi:putative addiction module component (TIGR02574 family)
MDNILLIHEALKLPPFERAQLIDALWQSLDPIEQASVDLAWTEDAKERLTAFRRGEIEALSGPDALDEIEAELIR